jgi:hypothetical protein
MPTDEALARTIAALERALHEQARSLLYLGARCDALSLLLGGLAAKSGIAPEQYEAQMERLTAERVQCRLEQFERENPGLAAQLDDRPTHPE